MLRQMLQNKKATAGLVILAAFALLVAVGPFVVADPTAMLATPLAPPSSEHWLGTTAAGQDVLAQTVVGARTTLGVSFLVGAGVVLLGALVGTTAGYFRGWVDDALSLFTNVFLVMPGLPLMVVIATYLPAGPTTISAILIVTGWAWSARVVRSQALALRNKDWVSAAIVSGESHLRIIVFEMLPNMTSLLVSAFIGAVVYALAAQVGLEFLGLGDSNVVSWGTNLYWASNDGALLTESWWTFVPTGLGVAIVGFGLTLVNFGVDELTNPRLAGAGAVITAATPVRRTHAEPA